MQQSRAFLAGKRCLVLEDDYLILLDLQQTLEAAGAKVSCFGTATAALKTLGDSSFDLALLDIKLNDSPHAGATVAAALAERGIPFVFLTGLRADNADAQRFPNAPLVEKPYRVEALMAVLRTALKGEAEPGPGEAS